MKKHGRFAIILFCAAEVSIQLSAQNYYQFTQEDSPHPVTEIQYTGGKSYILVERTDLRRYENGKYIGLTSRETKSYITPEQQNGSTWLYDGSFYVDEATKHNSMEVRGGVNEAVESKFTIDKNGHFTMIVDNGFPSFRSFPSYTNQELFTGAKWVSKSERSVDPLNKGKFTKIPMTVEYTFAGEDVFNEEPVYVINAQWATRYTANNYDMDGDPELKGAQGSHIAKIFISQKTGAAVYVRDSVNEAFMYSNGKQIVNKGTINLFTKYPPTFDRTEVYSSIAKNFGTSGGSGNGYGKYDEEFRVNTTAPGPNLKSDFGKVIKGNDKIKIENTSSGLKFTMEDLKFHPDSAQLLPEEIDKIKTIADILSNAKNRMFLIEGHTARTGYTEGEDKLSVERAKTIANLLFDNGIELDKMICRGSGSRKPIDSNDTPEGRARNRRVEITILE